MADAQQSTSVKRIALAITAAASLAIPAEGIRQAAYKDPVGITTICVGHTGPDVKLGQLKTRDECMGLLSEDMRKAVVQVDRCQPGLPFSVLVAFSDAAFNIGPTVACDTSRSTAARRLRERNYYAACQELLRWNKANVGGVMVALPGLTNRRQAERDVCIKDVGVT